MNSRRHRLALELLEDRRVLATIFDVHEINSVGTPALELTSADLDGDGDLDIVTSAVEWYENLGNRNFLAHPISERARGFDVLATDLDGDGDVDLVLPSIESGLRDILWYENDGTGKFTERVLADLGDSQPSDVDAADFDGDGDLDVVSADPRTRSLELHVNAGSMQFATRSVAQIQNARRSHAIDFDLDGNTDIISVASDQVYWFRNDGLANFTQVELWTGDVTIREGILTDIDKDGDLDILLGTDGGLAILRNDGQSNFTYELLNEELSQIIDLAVDDFDGDGDLDIAGSNYESAFWFENESGEFASQLFAESSQPIGVHSIDIDSDGQIDIIMPKAIQFGSDDEFETQEIGLDPGAGIAIPADIDGDGDNDVISTRMTMANEEASDIQFGWYENDSDAFSSWHPLSGEFRISNSIFGDQLGGVAEDIDGDGDVDFAASIYLEDGTFQYSWFESDENQSFAQRMIFNAQAGGTSLQAHDIDSDGDIDLVGVYQWFENDGLENFTSHEYPTGATSQDGETWADVDVVDFDSDGDLDILTTEPRVGLYLNDGNGGFLRGSLSVGRQEARRIDAADFDNDGDTDLFIAWESNQNSITLQTHENLGSGFQAETLASIGWDGGDIEIADFDANGEADFWITSGFTRLYNQYEGELTLQRLPRTTNSIVSDFDSDGDIDVITGDAKNRLQWFENLGTPSGDFDGDGSFGCQDVNQLTNQISSFGGDFGFDLNLDGVVSADDLKRWLAIAGATNLPSGDSYKKGDANLDGVVDTSDFNIWNSHKFTQNSNWCDGDFNASGSVDVSDFNLWNLNKFSGDESQIASILLEFSSDSQDQDVSEPSDTRIIDMIFCKLAS